MALTSRELSLMEELEAVLSERYGVIELSSDPFCFSDFTSYYEPEMGNNLQKKFISFSGLIPIETLPQIKHETNAVEQHYTVEGKRRINLDPGYVTHAHLVLATTKPYSHRIYLGQGIFAELTYLCKGKNFYPLEWTYFDYREDFVKEFFVNVRRSYLRYTRSHRKKANP